jgi:hypothetical protein
MILACGDIRIGNVFARDDFEKQQHLDPMMRLCKSLARCVAAFSFAIYLGIGALVELAVDPVLYLITDVSST